MAGAARGRRGSQAGEPEVPRPARRVRHIRPTRARGVTDEELCITTALSDAVSIDQTARTKRPGRRRPQEEQLRPWRPAFATPSRSASRVTRAHPCSRAALVSVHYLPLALKLGWIRNPLLVSSKVVEANRKESINACRLGQAVPSGCRSRQKDGLELLPKDLE